MIKKRPSDFGDFIRALRIKKGLSVRAVAQNSGGGISGGYVSQIENKYVRSVTAEKLRALAKGLGVNDEELLRAAAGFYAQGEDELRDSVLYKVHQRLKTASPENRRIAEEVLEMLLDRLDRHDRKSLS